MKFINYLESIAGVSVFPLISLLIFVVFFSFCVLYAFKVDVATMDEMKNIPLDDNTINK
jgi:cytochrome c oxidase cbb3-type subunit III